MKDVIIEKGKKYFIIYDDKGFKVMKKEGIVVSKEGTLIKLDSGEILNTNNIIRAKKVSL